MCTCENALIVIIQLNILYSYSFTRALMQNVKYATHLKSITLKQLLMSQNWRNSFHTIKTKYQ